MNILSLAKRFVQAYRGRISLIRLNEDDVSTALSGNTLELAYEIRRNVSSAMLRGNREIIDIKLLPLLLEFLEFVSNQAANDRIPIKRNEGDKVFPANQGAQIFFTRRRALVGVRLSKCLAEYREK
jgi:hypothetical protein